MYFIKLFCCLSFVATLVYGTQNQNPYSAKINSLECEFSPALCERNVCILKPVNRRQGNMTVGCFLRRDQPKLKLRFEVFTKSSSNAYYPGAFRFEDDYCAMMASSKTGIFATNFNLLFDHVKPCLPSCPVKGKFMIEKCTIDGNWIPSNLHPSGDYKLEIRLYNPQNETIVIIKFHATIKNQFF